MDDLLKEFLTETSESMDVLDVELVKLEQNPNDPELLGNIFRLVHTIKGTCGFLGLPRLESVAHAGENVLGKIRDGELEVTPTAVSLVLECLDRIKVVLAGLEASEHEPEGDDTDLIARLNIFAEGGDVPASGAAGSDGMAADEPAQDAGFDDDAAAAQLMEQEPDEFGFVPVPAAAMGQAVAEADFQPAPQSPPPPVAAPAKPPAKSLEKPSDAAPAGRDADAVKESAVAAQTIRVNVDLLENLMTMVSELVLTRNQLMQILRSEKESEFTTPLQRLSHVTTELQEGVMKTRMQPIGNAWAKLPRIIRDLSVELRKKIDLQMLGADTELDRQVLELIKDPLTHMVRNSADHGIEVPGDRVAAGKSDTGTITLNAYHEGGHIIIEINDDGRGLNTARIKEKAISAGIVSEADAENMSDQQIDQFIFHAGLSTAQAVTSVSGRGVGMDVVKTNIEKIGGTIELKSVQGKGTSFSIKIPLTLAIVSALIIECAGERFAIPQISVVELVRASANSEHKIECIQGTPVLRLRNRLLPLVSLRRALSLEELAPEDGGDETFVVVAQVGTYTFGIIVDRVFDTEEIVVKPSAPVLRHISKFSGNTILGDGSVIMILDPNGVAAETGEIQVADQAAQDAAPGVPGQGEDRVTLLLFRAGDDTPKAVPLALVARLEEINLAKVEWSNGKPMVQYRDRLMPLVPTTMDQVLGREGRQPLIVFSDRQRSMGLVVDEIFDIVEDRLSVELSGDRAGVIGSAIIAGQATDVIDTGHYLTQAFQDWFAPDDTGGSRSSTDQRNRLLLVDDSPFFRNLIAPILKVAGFSVTVANSGADALDLHDRGVDFDVIVSDIEMPDMDGFSLAEALRGGSRWQEIPIIALSSHTSPRDLERGRKVGFTDYVAKFDRDALLHSLEHSLSEEVAH